MAQGILVVPSNLEAELMGTGAYDTKIYPPTPPTDIAFTPYIFLVVTNISQPLRMSEKEATQHLGQSCFSSLLLCKLLFLCTWLPLVGCSWWGSKVSYETDIQTILKGPSYWRKSELDDSHSIPHTVSQLSALL